MNMKRIKGILVPSNPEAVTEKTRRNLLVAVREGGLSGLVQSGAFNQGSLEINSCTVTAGGHYAVFNFIGDLDKVILTEGVAELGLEGTFMLSVDTNADPILFRITVRNGEISYQQADFVWPESITFGK